MVNVKVYGRSGSTYMKKIRKWLGNHPLSGCSVAVNYGLQGEKAARYERQNPSLLRLPILNHRQYGNKYDQIVAVAEAGEVIPLSWHSKDFDPTCFVEDKYIVKPYYSLGGRGIKVWNGNAVSAKKYIQEKIDNRRYEMRVHAFAWIRPEDWIIQKRVHEDGENVLAWNHHNGGRFITIQNPTDPLHNRVREATKTAMKALNYQFGAADYIIQNPESSGEPLKHYFLEWNLAPGWTIQRVIDFYQTSFLALQAQTMEDIAAITDGVYPWDDISDNSNNSERLVMPSAIPNWAARARVVEPPHPLCSQCDPEEELELPDEPELVPLEAELVESTDEERYARREEVQQIQRQLFESLERTRDRIRPRPTIARRRTARQRYAVAGGYSMGNWSVGRSTSNDN